MPMFVGDDKHFINAMGADLKKLTPAQRRIRRNYRMKLQQCLREKSLELPKHSGVVVSSKDSSPAIKEVSIKEQLRARAYKAPYLGCSFTLPTEKLMSGGNCTANVRRY